MIKRRYSVLLLVLILQLSLISASVYAIADPDTSPQINSADVYENVLEEGDLGVLISYDIPYAVLPDESATESFLAVFIDTDGATQLKSVAPYAFDNDGYDNGIIWIRFSPSEVASYSLDAASIALYEIWLTGNPTLTWPSVPPKTIGVIEDWSIISDPGTVLSLRVLYHAMSLEAQWGVDLIEETALGNKLTSTGESYFANVIPNLRDMAPNVFASGTSNPILEDLDYSTGFGATMTNGTGTVSGSPITLTEGANSVTSTVVGTLVLELEAGTSGTMENDTGTVTGSPVSLAQGTNTVTVTVNGDFDVTVNLDDTKIQMQDTILGTGLDLTALATIFGMSRLMFSGIVWLFVTVIICAYVYKAGEGSLGFGANTGKVVMLVFMMSIVGGSLLGLMHPLVAALMFIGFGAVTGYVLFFRGANI